MSPGRSELEEGDHVVAAYIPACGRCAWCARGRSNLCDVGARIMGGVAIADGTHRTTVGGRGAAPMSLLGTFSPDITVHESQAVRIRTRVRPSSWSAAAASAPTPCGARRRRAPPG
ncbi:alcohol dehydrogenase catalytic domain-containing protein [Pseudonocardia sp.]|uniref:alcohol dehydrogenase catalytic domain-containing protein n=1 Tax=Pseudonocardia sp. TaxID=60912 RepID=UPI0039C9A56D